MPWLMRADEVLAAVETGRARLRGWPPGGVDGALVVRGPGVVHTLCSPQGVDIAWCAPGPARPPDLPIDGCEGLEVRRTATLGSRRVARPLAPGATAVVAGAGAFERWRLRAGDRLQVTG
ncbi:MAG: hypothetical protein ACRDY0_01775 [Acidimicrobiales bacterium]